VLSQSPLHPWRQECAKEESQQKVLRTYITYREAVLIEAVGVRDKAKELEQIKLDETAEDRVRQGKISGPMEGIPPHSTPPTASQLRNLPCWELHGGTLRECWAIMVPAAAYGALPSSE